MKVGLTYDLRTDWLLTDQDPRDASAEFDKPKTIEEISEALRSGGHEVVRIGNVRKLLETIDDLDVDIVFNICEGLSGRNRESQVPVILEMKGIPYVGADGLTLGITLDKAVTKKCFMADGLPTPRFFQADSSEGLREKNTIGFPLIVKTSFEGTSKGISEDSRVEDYAGLKRQIDLVTKVYAQPALVEEFISGTEFTVPVLGNGKARAMPVIQVSMDGSTDLGDKFYTFERVSADSLRYVCPADIPDNLIQRLQDLAVKAYHSVGCRDMGRVDFRVDKKGDPFILEINPLPCLSKEDVFNYFPQVLGTTYDRMINRILEHALDRYGMSLTEQKTAGLQAGRA